ncbi:hypothetical protein GCM10010472_10910 [Pseudonocardia halophobica]|uniref:Uncharacterized protein n=1 Tax=Pseudonocardia halophobica TaxID=29401 RepID=A0A9W6L582_9PSEU|nr:hypothetical protein [Pseudonocardia halophobica]GLL13478.1 hypothetical protein GCM10017577_46220 [Pseudonocardia halophobica]
MHERDVWQQLSADRDLINRAARQLRHDTVMDQYAGRTNPDPAFGLASVLDEIALRLGDLDVRIRAKAVEVCRDLVELRRPADQ